MNSGGVFIISWEVLRGDDIGGGGGSGYWGFFSPHVFQVHLSSGSSVAAVESSGGLPGPSIQFNVNSVAAAGRLHEGGCLGTYARDGKFKDSAMLLVGNS